MNLLCVVKGLLLQGKEGINIAQLKIVNRVKIKRFIFISQYAEKL